MDSVDHIMAQLDWAEVELVEARSQAAAIERHVESLRRELIAALVRERTGQPD